MSFWAYVGPEIKDLEVFSAACTYHNLVFDAKTLTIRNSLGYEVGSLRSDHGRMRLYMDTDKKWSELARQIGEDGGKLVQAYARGVVDKQVTEMGGLITSEEHLEDGSIRLQVSVGGI